MDAKDLRIAELEARVAELEALVQVLLARLEKYERSSKNSNRPPSSDGPGARSGEKKTSTGRKRGGQVGRRGQHRTLLPVDQVHQVVPFYPSECESCWSPLAETPDLCATRHQVTDLPEIAGKTTEFQCHAVTCGCGHETRAKLPAWVPTSSFGPRLTAFMVLLTGVFHVSRRQAVDLLGELGVSVSLGALSEAEGRVSQALAASEAEIEAHIDAAPVKHADGTTWLQSGGTRSLWTIATQGATLFRVFTDGAAASIRPLFGACRGILVSDRATVFGFWDSKLRQICWAHLKRKFISFAESAGRAGAVGRELLDCTSLIFKYWHDYKAGRLKTSRFREWMAVVQAQTETCLQRAAVAEIGAISGSCRDILGHKEALWTFTTIPGVEPTNNHAERELRSFVLWRKGSFGAQSDRGSRFAVRVMSVAHTARKQGWSVFGHLVTCCEAMVRKTPVPLLFPAPP